MTEIKIASDRIYGIKDTHQSSASCSTHYVGKGNINLLEKGLNLLAPSGYKFINEYLMLDSIGSIA